MIFSLRLFGCTYEVSAEVSALTASRPAAHNVAGTETVWHHIPQVSDQNCPKKSANLNVELISGL